MPAGTITLTNNSTAVTGSGTAFPTELKANDFLVAVVGGTTYTLGVKSVESASALTLTTAYGGPTTGGLAWTPIPNGTLVGITAQIAADTARAIRGLNYDKQNWQQVYSASGNITVTLPDGSTYNGPSWNSVVTSVSNKAAKGNNSDITSLSGLTTPLSLDQGGLGASDAAGGRSALKLGTAATSNVTTTWLDTTSGALLKFGDFGIGTSSAAPVYSGQSAAPVGFYTASPSTISNPGSTGIDSSFIQLSGVSVNQRMMMALNVYGGGRAFLRRYYNAAFGEWAEFYTTNNTTKGSDGTLKAASPIVKIFATGRSEVNDESEGVMVTRQGVGEYLIEGCMGLNADAGWSGIDGGFDIPKDRNRQPLVWLDYEVHADGSVLVKTYHRTYPNAPKFAQNEISGFADGDPVDIPADQYISVRVGMPHESIFNKNMIEAMKASEEAAQSAAEEAERIAAEQERGNEEKDQS